MENRLLKSKMVLHGDNHAELAKYLDIALPTVSNKINGKTDWTQTEMLMIKSRYDLTDEEYIKIFDKEVVV